MKFISDNGPHIKSDDSTRKIMTRLLIALMPIVCFAIFKNSILVYLKTNASVIDVINPILMIIVGIVTSYLSEALYIKIFNKKSIKDTIRETSKSFAVIPGLFLALVLPANTPLYLVCFGAFTGSVIGKMIFGGFGNNIFNPALIGYLMVSASYQGLVGSYLNLYELDTISGATALTNLSNMGYYGSYDALVSPYGSLFNFLFGMIPGTIGEVSKLLIILAFIYLTITKTIKWRIPVMYTLTVFLSTFIIGNILSLGVWYPLFHVLSGGLLFGAVFMATDPVTSPITKSGQVLYGISLGILTVLLRFLTPYPEGVMTSILFMNLLVFLFDKIGLKIKNDKKNLVIPYIIIILLFISVSLGIGFKVNKEVLSKDNKDNLNVDIIDIKDNGNTRTYNVSSKGWGVIKASIEVSDDKIISILITDSSSETQWNEIEKVNYLDDLIKNQDDIDSLDAVSGSTRTSNGLKNMIKKVKGDINEK